MPPAPAAKSCPQPHDGGWGWIVVIGAFISLGFSYTIPKVLSIFFQEIKDDLGCTLSELALISSIMLAALYGGGPLSSVLVNCYGSRPIVIAGGLMCGVSMAIASFGTSIIYLYVFIGVLGGLGLSFNLNASVTIISKYFLVKRPLANGLAMAGSPVFLCFMAPLNQLLLDQFGWRGSLLILGGLILNCCVAGALMRPVVTHCEPLSSAAPQNKEQPSQVNTALKPPKTCKTILDFSFFKERGFIIYIIGNAFFLFGAYAPVVFISTYAISQGVGKYEAAYLLSIMGFVDMFIRPGTGLLANTKWIRPRIQYFFSFAIVFNGLSHLLGPLMRGYTPLVVYTVLFGMSFGMVFALIFECLTDLIGSERFPSAVGLVTIIESFPVLLGPPAAGLLLDLTGDYKYLLFMCGSVILTGGIFLFIMNAFHYHMLNREAAAECLEHGGKTTQNQDQIEMKPATEAGVERTEPEAKENSGAQREPCPENNKTPN